MHQKAGITCGVLLTALGLGLRKSARVICVEPLAAADSNGNAAWPVMVFCAGRAREKDGGRCRDRYTKIAYYTP